MTWKLALKIPFQKVYLLKNTFEKVGEERRLGNILLVFQLTKVFWNIPF
jgi:hypothetical protein